MVTLCVCMCVCAHCILILLLLLWLPLFVWVPWWTHGLFNVFSVVADVVGDLLVSPQCSPFLNMKMANTCNSSPENFLILWIGPSGSARKLTHWEYPSVSDVGGQVWGVFHTVSQGSRQDWAAVAVHSDLLINIPCIGFLHFPVLLSHSLTPLP